MTCDLSPVELLALDEAALAAPGARSVVAFSGSDAFAEALAHAFAGATVRSFRDTVAPTVGAPVGVTRHGLTAELLAGADLVVGVLPKALAELEELALLTAGHAAPTVRLILAGREKHLTRSMNDVLAQAFQSVSASRGRQKSRALRAEVPRGDSAIPAFPRVAIPPGLPFAVHAHGAAFAGTKLDIGTRALLDVLPEAVAACGIAPDAAATILDLGCGTGVLATSAALLRPNAQVIASDRSWAAAASAACTVAEAGVAERVRVQHEPAAATVASASVDLVLLNPPFHDGHTVDEDMASALFAAAARVLRPGRSVLTVYNSHLPHRPALARLVGPTTQLHRTAKFTITRSIAR